MVEIELLIIASVGLVLMLPLAARLAVPFPVLLTLFGMVVAFIPGLPPVTVDPDLLLSLLLPPILWAASQRLVPAQLKARARSILSLAVWLVVASALLAGFVLTMLLPELPWPLAFAVGAALAPPDPVAATAVAGRVGLPYRVVTVIEGEGIVNDATSITLYHIGLMAAIAGSSLSWWALGRDFALNVIVGIGVGVAVAWAGRWALARLNDPVAEGALTVMLPFVAYLAAEPLRGSSVIAVLTAGLGMSSLAIHRAGPETRLIGRAFWEVVDLLLTGVAFTLIGLELRTIAQQHQLTMRNILIALAVCAALIVVRVCWLAGAGLLTRRRATTAEPDEAGPAPANVREGLVMGWAGMRGVVTIALVLAVPRDLPERDVLVLVAFVVVLVTLTLSGTTLPVLVRWLGVGNVDQTEQRAQVRTVIHEAVVDRLAELREEGTITEELQVRLKKQTATALGALANPTESTAAQESKALRQDMLDVAREAAVNIRLDPTIDPRIVDEVLTTLDRSLATLRRT